MILERRLNINIERMVSDLKNSLGSEMLTGEMIQILEGIAVLLNRYNSAIREVSTKLEILDDEFQMLHSHNPIHHIESRLKSPRSILEKAARRGLALTIDSVRENITDIAGIRVMCHYIDEVYAISELLEKQEDIAVIKKSDYIKHPKPSGYRSLHLVVSVPVFLSSTTERVPVEVQIRTVAMDYWASLEHEMRYKGHSGVNETLKTQLKDCAETLFATDLRMQDIYNKLNG
jgi:putative GTP pyrophosphokinase